MTCWFARWTAGLMLGAAVFAVLVVVGGVAIATVGGHATLIRGDEESRRRVAVFQPPSRVEAALAQRLKDNFDPHRIFNPGRMYEGL